MAEGFKVADAYIAVHTEDDTRAGRERINKDTDRWAKESGDKAGDSFAKSLLSKIALGLRAMLMTLMQFAVISSIVTVIGTAVAALGGYVVQLMGVLNTLAGSIIQAAGALLLLPGAFAVVLGSLLTLKLAFGGIGAALKAGMQQAGGAVQQQIDGIVKAFDKLTGALLGWRASQRTMEADFEALRKALQASGGSLDITNEKGRAAAAATDDIIKAAQQAAQAKYNETHSIAEANKVYDQYMQRLRDTLAAGGVAQDQIKSLVDAVSQFPTTAQVAAGGTNALSQAMANLSKNAQEVVKALLQMKPLWMGIRNALQDALFVGVAAQLKSIAGTLVPTLTAGFTTLGGALHNVLEQLLAFLGAGANQSRLAGIFGGIAGVLNNISKALAPLLTVALTIINASLAALQALTGGLADKAIGWVDKIQKMVDSGRFQELIDNGVQALKVLGRWFVDVYGIIKGIFKPAGQGDFFGWFDRLNKLINSAPVQNTLVQVFNALRIAADLFTPVLGTLMTQLGHIVMGFATLVPVVAPLLDLLFKALGPAIVALMPVLGQVFDMVGQVALLLVGPLQGAIQVLGELLVGVAPAISQVLRGLGPVIDQLVAVAPIVGKALGDLIRAIAPIIPILGPVLGTLFTVLAQAISQIAQDLGPTLPGLFQALADALVQLAPLIPALLPLLPPLVEGFATIVKELGPQLPDLVKSTVDLVLAIAPLLPWLVKLLIWGQDFVVKFQVKPTIDAVTWAIKILTWFINWLVDAWKTLGDWLPKAGKWFSDVGDAIKDFFKAVWKKLTDFWDWITNLPGTILDNVKNFATLLYDKGRDLISGLIDGIKSKAGDLIKTIKEGVTDLIPDFIKNAWNSRSPAKRFMPIGASAVEGMMVGVQSKAPDLKRMLTDTFGAMTNGSMAGGLMPAMAGGGAAHVTTGPTFIQVQIGERPVTDMVTATLTRNPQAVAVAADEGNRQRAYLNPGRKRVGDR